eukprot:4394542-Prymnesium_polylepis.1
MVRWSHVTHIAAATFGAILCICCACMCGAQRRASMLSSRPQYERLEGLPLMNTKLTACKSTD